MLQQPPHLGLTQDNPTANATRMNTGMNTDMDAGKHAAAPIVIALRNVVKAYPGVRAVDDVSLNLRRGEVHGLVGENGAGKSTLIKILAGAVALDSGTITLDGAPVYIQNAQGAMRLGLAVLHQELNLVPYFNAVENIFLGHPYPRTPWGSIAWRPLRQHAQEVLAQLNIEPGTIPLDLPASRLAPGQQTLVSIARALATFNTAGLRLVVMDEPTAALSSREIDGLHAAIRALTADGVAVLYVSHRLHEIFSLTNRVTVMRNGRVVATQPTVDVTETQLVGMMTGRQAATAFPPRVTSLNETPKSLLTVEGLSSSVQAKPSVRDVSFSLQAGEVLGVAGLVGAGRTELLRLLFGVDRAASGTITLHGGTLSGVPLRAKSPADALARGLALVPEERRTQGLVLSRAIVENVTLSHLPRFASAKVLLNRPRERRAAQSLGEALGLVAASLRQPVSQLSGGNQQKVVLARCLAEDADAGRPTSLRVLLLDEPTRGIDVGAKQEIYAIIRDLTRRGVGVVLVSSELPELLALADRVLVLHEGRQVALVEVGEVNEETLLRLCYGLAAEGSAGFLQPSGLGSAERAH